MAQATKHRIDRDVPDYMTSAAEKYINEGRRPGGFLLKLLQNDLAGAVSNADMQNRAAIRQWVFWLQMDIPSAAWGDQESVREWMEHDGLDGW